MQIPFTKAVLFALSALTLGLSGQAYANGCPLPWGGVLAEGDSLIAWNYSNPPFGTHCRSEIRSCEGGFLTGSFSSSHCAESARLFDFRLLPETAPASGETHAVISQSK